MTRNGDNARAREDLLAAALAHAQRGWHVFPLRPGSKRPALHGQTRCPRTGPCAGGHQGWEQRATTDPGRIRACWQTGPYNIAIACGRAGLVVLDLDTPGPGEAPPAHAGISNGAGVLASLCEQRGRPWPVTFTVATPGGSHLYFTAPAGVRLRNTTGRLGPRIDTRAAGGYVVAPGSVTRDGRYTIASPAAPQPLPAWLATLLTGPAVPPGTGIPACPLEPTVAHAAAYAHAALKSEIRRVTHAPRGRRNDTLNQAAFALGQLTAAGLLPVGLVRVGLTVAACRVGLDRDSGCGMGGIEATIRSGLTAGARNPRTSAA